MEVLSYPQFHFLPSSQLLSILRAYIVDSTSIMQEQYVLFD